MILFERNKKIKNINEFIEIGCCKTEKQLEVKDLESFIMEEFEQYQKVHAIFYKTYMVQTAIIENGIIKRNSEFLNFECDHIIEVRFFNQEMEIRIIKIGNKFIGVKLENDMKNEKKLEAYIQLHSLVGNYKNIDSSGTYLTDNQRGMKYFLPFECNIKEFNSLDGCRDLKSFNPDIFVGSITYIEYNHLGMPETLGSRLCGYYRIDNNALILEVV